MEALRKTARFQTENEGGVRGGIRPQGQERNGQQQRRAREGGAKVVKRNAKGHPTTGAEMRAQEEDDNGTRRFQLLKPTTVEEIWGPRSPVPSPFRELFARIRFGRCPNVNSQETSWRATVTTHFGLHDDVKMLCGTIMRDSGTFKEMECAKTNDQQWNRTVCDSFNVRAATPTPSMTGTASPQTTTH